MNGEMISRAQLMLQYYAALNELAQEEKQPAARPEPVAYFPGFQREAAAAQAAAV